MKTEGIQIFRLILAAVNGLTFSIGIYAVLEIVKFKPNRMKRRLRWLIAEAEREEIADDTPPEEPAKISDKREEINKLKIDLDQLFRNPVTLIKITFSMLIVAVSLVALISLLNPAFQLFM
ncbi:MAG: hypothetical protein P9L92_03860 [Candidatus Electryonea clarkiae]|nr:hypothetical protein [Candidatus Electryonea clarkiae]MDP8286952.1 hypothetical protein [Candidatus Electryonea clarkiae]